MINATKFSLHMWLSLFLMPFFFRLCEFVFIIPGSSGYYKVFGNVEIEMFSLLLIYIMIIFDRLFRIPSLLPSI
jgi:hypothetical protein